MKHKTAFLTGIIAAAILCAAVFEPLAIFAFAQGELNEFALIKRFKLFNGQRINRGFMNKTITSNEFYSALEAVLYGLGLIDKPTNEALLKAEVLEQNQFSRYISRESGAVCVLRSIMLAWAKKAAPRPEEVIYTPTFKDWQIDSAYLSTLIFAKNKGIIRGVSKNRFKPTALLKRREAVCLLARLYNFVNKAKNNLKATAAGVIFTDVPKDHFMLEPIAQLDKAGAFMYTKLGNKLSPTKKITVNDMILIARGIINKQAALGIGGALNKLNAIWAGSDKNKPCSRLNLAVIASVAAEATARANDKSLADSVLSFNAHAFAKPNKALMKASVELLDKMGIRLGYKGKLCENEYVTRYEALGVMLKIIKANGCLKAENDKSQAATRADAKAFAEKLKKRRAEIRHILRRD